jgi:hypothetical protein
MLSPGNALSSPETFRDGRFVVINGRYTVESTYHCGRTIDMLACKHGNAAPGKSLPLQRTLLLHAIPTQTSGEPQFLTRAKRSGEGDRFEKLRPWSYVMAG